MTSNKYNLAYGPAQIPKGEPHRRGDTIGAFSDQQLPEVSSFGESSVVGEVDLSSFTQLADTYTVRPKTMSEEADL